MANQPIETAKPKHGRSFKVVKGQVGAWSEKNGDVFTEAEFKKLHPIPDTDAAKRDIDPDSYHTDLLGRLLGLNVIAHAPDAEPTPTPLGPEGQRPAAVKNVGIATSVDEGKAAAAQVAALKSNDAAQASAPSPAK